MATLIQSKQIQGVVTASVIEGEFSVSGSSFISGSQFVDGDISSSGIISASGYVYGNVFVGDGSQLTFGGTSLVSGSTQVTISSTSGFAAFSSSIATSIAGITGTDNQTLSFNQASKQLTISDGNTIDLSSLGGGGGGGSSIWTTGSDFYKVSSNLQVTGSFSATSLTGSIAYSNLTGVPTLFSSSAQITALGFVSESGDSTPAGTISGSAQITALGFISSSHTDISSLNTFTSSIQSEVDSLTTATSSYLTSIDSGIVSSSAQVTELLPSGVISGSSQVTITESQISDLSHTDISLLNTFTSSIQTEVDGLSSATSSYLTSIPEGTISGSEQLPSGLVSGSTQVVDSLPSGVISGSSQITITESQISDLSHTDISSLNTFTSSIQTQVDGLSSETSSYLTSSGSVDFSDITSLPSGLISGSSQLTASYDTRYQLSGSSIPFNGNRIVSQEKLPTMFSSSFNPGTSGSVVDFLNAIFYPNTQPSITSGNQTISEYSASSSPIFTLEATDPEGQSLTFGTSSDYTDDLVRVASNGVVTLNATATSASFNTDLVGGSHGHTFTATATDTFGAEVTKDITIFVTPNAAPQFRETSIIGNVITNITASLNENSSNGTLVKRVFFTDAESDAITIDSSSILPAGGSTHFTITKYSTYIDIEQNTGSLDYETYPVYTFSLSASDEHYQNSDDPNSIVTLPVSISVVDNVHPTINNQTLSSINENSLNGATVGTISATDSDGDAITFSEFTLYKLELDNVNVPSGSYGGTSQASDPHENPFQMNSSGQVTRKTGIFLNSDLINEYQYTVRVRDSFNTASNEAIVTIPIDDDIAATLTDNWSSGPFIKESELSGTTIKTTNYGSTTADYNSNQSGTWSSSNPAISINSNGNLSLGVDLSGSVTQSGDTLDSTITFTNTFGTTTTDNLSVTIVANSAPTATFTDQSSNFNTNLATTGTTMVSMSITDTEGDTPYSASLGGTNAGDLQLVYTNSNSSSVGIQANGNLSAGTYNYDVVVTDSYSKSTTYSGRSFTIAQADTGTLGGDTTSYIIESAVSGALIRESSNGRTGNQAQLTVSYSPSYGSPSVTSFTSSLNEIIAINSSGQLSLLVDLSGSATSSGDTITPTITFQDQYGNLGSGSITINVAANQAPTATFTDQSANFETDFALSGSTMVSMSISDDESDTPFSASISGSNLELVYSSADSSSVGIHATSDLTARTHTYSVTVFDQFGKSRTYSDRTFTVVQSSDYGKTYVYRSSYGSDAGLSSNYLALMGASTVDSSTPPEVTTYTANDTSPFRLISSSLGDSTLNLAGGETANLVATLSGSDLDTIISESNPFTMGNSAEQYIIVVPSGSDMIGIPTSMTDGFGDNTVGRYVMAIKADGGSWGQEGSTIHLIDTSGSFNGYDKHFVIGRTGHNSAASVEIRLIEASGSLPS